MLEVRSHHNDLIKEAVLRSGNQLLFLICYTPKTNAVEQYFNQFSTRKCKTKNIKIKLYML